ncbi:unnamed protein product [Adineta steineri]|uniref:Protein kinase domain-containing protein n=1 Tax=Adineta steineri TaxID=433720 RepID=A0A813N2H4_9BILA|nr:unnamed protein product [Adineta steineri]CAF3531771.1 unnamed protein product [Adineta steineri]
MSDSDILIKGDLIKSRWRITQKIGGGGFGQIYQAYDKLRRELVAVKVESNSQPRQGIRMEVTVLRRIQNREHVCELFSGGISTLYNYMVMTLLGSSLSELRKNLKEQCFTLSTTLRISLQILEAIESIHSIGFLHRDIKPSNFAIGRKNVRQIFILDFGLARKYTDYDQHVRPARVEAGFRGTIRYASVNAHNNRELGRHDDLWSFFYMLIEFLIGSLPWSKIKDKESVGHIKETYDYTRFLTNLPDEFNKFLEHINELNYDDKPDYDFLRSLFNLSIQRLGFHDDDLYDWEKSIEQKPITVPDNERIHHTDLKNNRQVIKSSSRTGLFKKHTESDHNLPLQQSHFVIGTGDQQHIIHNKVSSQLENRSPDTLTRRGQATSNGLFTYISQQFSNAAASGAPSVFSQWLPHNGETLTDDDILKGNKSSSSRADERATTLSGERTSSANIKMNHPISSIKNNSAGRTSYMSIDEYNLPPKSQRSIERNIQVPFGTYTKNNRRQNPLAFNLQRSSRKKSDYS